MHLFECRSSSASGFVETQVLRPVYFPALLPIMKDNNLMIALTFAAIFGAALVYLILWHIHRYIHQRCLDLEHWFHVLSPHPSKTCTEKTEMRERSKQRSRSRKRERGGSESRRYHDRDGSADWSRQRDVERARPMMLLDTPQQPYGQSYYPAIGWQDPGQGASQMMYGQQMPWQNYGMAQMTPLTMPQQPFPQMAARIPEPAQHQTPYQTHDGSRHQQAHVEIDTPKTGRRKSTTVKPEFTKKAPPVEKVDYIYICDEYPPIIQEALKRAAPRPSSSSSCSSETSGTTEEVLRANIPRATPGFTTVPPLQFPQYPQMATRAWNTPRSYPRQWMGEAIGGDGANIKARYAPFPPLSGCAERPYRRRRPAPAPAPVPAPSNTHPEL